VTGNVSETRESRRSVLSKIAVSYWPTGGAEGFSCVCPELHMNCTAHKQQDVYCTLSCLYAVMLHKV
jgi:hypothetical protein